MPTYVYRFTDTDEDETVEVVQSIKAKPLTEIVARPVERVMIGGISGYVNPFDNKYPYVSRRLPKNLKGCKTNADGLTIVESKSHEADICARTGYHRE